MLGYPGKPMKYFRPCDHCGGEIILDYTPRIPPGRLDRPHWRCHGCGCLWNLDWVLKEKGYKCPVHGQLADKGT